MERRKFLIGMGTVATGSAATIGTGAFNFANVERSAGIDVVDDSNAYLALNDTSEYASTSEGGDLTLDFETQEGGSGINENSDYSFIGVFSIENQGSQPVGVWINDDDSSDAANWYGSETTSDQGAFDTSIEGNNNAYALDVGEAVYVNLVVETRGDSEAELPGTINVVGDASAGN